jgi:hypothetical protein
MHSPSVADDLRLRCGVQSDLRAVTVCIALGGMISIAPACAEERVATFAIIKLEIAGAAGKSAPQIAPHYPTSSNR